MKICLQWVFRWLISHTLSDFQNSKWWIQYGGKKFREMSNFYENLYMGTFWNADYESAVKFLKFKMAVTIWRPTILKIVLFTCKSYENSFTVGFSVSDFEFAVSVSKFKMAERNFDKFPIFTKICVWGFSGMLITNPLSDFENLKWRFQSYSGFVISDAKKL